MKIAILGAGNVALASAGFLAREGHDVHLWSAYEAERSALAAAGGIRLEGEIEGRAPVTANADAGSCIEGAGLVVISAPAFGHATLMEAAAPHLRDGMDVAVHPVTGLSSLILSRLLRARGVKPTIVDLSTSLFTARKTGATAVRILRVKDLIEMSAMPAARGVQAIGRFEALFGKRFRLEPNALAISLNNHNPVYHVAPMLCNLSLVERGAEWIVWEAMTPGVTRLVKLVDEERLAVARHFGTTEVTVDDYFREAHGARGENLEEVFASVLERLRGPLGPQQFEHRFITEDVPYALVFFRALGRSAGIEMPMSEALIRITSALYRRDFTAEGHSLERLGLAGLSREEILAFARDGF